MTTFAQLQSPLNYGHLRYFWAVARERSVTRAAEKLNVSQPTVSAQIRELEETLGDRLLDRSGRGFSLTKTGRTVYRYAEEIFALGYELQEAVKGRAAGHPLVLTVGIADVIPKLLSHALIEPALRLSEAVQIVCLEDPTERLLVALAAHDVDIVLTDNPAGPSVRFRAYSHLLGDTGVVVLGSDKLVAAHRSGFPRSLDGAPFLLPTGQTMLRRSLDEWFDSQGIRPRVVGEFDDSALLEVFGHTGAGLFATPTAVEAEVRRQHGVKRLGELPGVRERFYGVTVERRLKHPAAVAIAAAARNRVFA
jgi:LysR family transcriptional regulator, transcriptional activator of nhaA